MITSYKYIAQTLCFATRDVLLASNKEWLERKHPGTIFEAHVGSGKSTYHTRLTKGHHRIKYGVKMVEAKHHSEERTASWTTGKEIISRGYFNGEITLQKALAHTVCHEYAHFIQVLGGMRPSGSVHNNDFYRILDRIHLSGAANNVLSYLKRDQSFSSLSFLDEDRIYEPIEKVRSTFSLGQIVTFKIKDQIYQGQIIKKNPKRAIVSLGNRMANVPYRAIV